MTKKRTLLLSLLAFVLLAIGAGIYFAKAKFDNVLEEKQAIVAKEKEKLQTATHTELEAKAALTEAQENLTALTQELSQNMEAEKKLSLSMVSQLQTYENILSDLKEYSENIEANLDILNEISSKSFQEDVKLQAALYKDKKPSLVAEHLQEFHAGRVGAILAQMKDKDASSVLDQWAVSGDPKVRLFYRQVMASYLDNKRYQKDPSLYQKLAEKEAPLNEEAFQQVDADAQTVKENS